MHFKLFKKILMILIMNFAFATLCACNSMPLSAKNEESATSINNIESVTSINDIESAATDTTEGSEKDNEKKESESEAETYKTDYVDIKYAKQFTIDNYSNGYRHINISGRDDYILLPEGCEEDNLGYDDVTFIHVPCDDIYLASTSVMDCFDCLDSLDNISFCSTKSKDYSIENAVARIEDGRIEYVGKYSAPDYEKLINGACSLAIENSMILHSPKIREELQDFGIPVLVEYSSYEEDPLGRLEWIKLYGILLGKEEEANSYFDEQLDKLNKTLDQLAGDNSQKPRIAFFYISSNGYVNVRKPGDYFSKMISMAGGEYALDDLWIEEENALSTVNIGWEDFYAYANDADIIIYNSNIDGGISSVEELIAKNALFSDFTAVKNAEVYVTNKNVFQETSGICEIVIELNRLINDDDGEYSFFEKVE